MSSSEEAKLLEDSVRRFAEEVIVPALDTMNHYPDHPLPKGMIEGLRELGLLEQALSSESDDDDWLVTATGALADTAAAPAALLLAHVLAQRLVLSGSGKGLEVEDGAGARLLAFPLYAEFEEAAVGVRYRVEGGVLRVWGVQEFVVNAPVADVLVVPATPADGNGGTGLLRIDVKTPGVQVHEPLLTLGMRGGPVADVTFDQVRVDAANLITGDALPLLRREHARLRAAVAALCAGVVGSSARAALAYAHERYQGGCYIVDHPEVRRMLSELMADRDVCLDAARALSDPALPEPRATHLFLRAKEAAARATSDGVQVLGGYGYMEDYGQERRMRDAKQAQCLLGRCDVVRQRAFADFLEQGAAP